ncbi:MAG: hypothetical protein HZC40_00625 [Chloroflexi bacterium]|nr:hypothetical protein [Chloroflexota bacterium]
MLAQLKTALPLRSPLALFSVIYLSFALTLTFYHMETIERNFWQPRQEFHEGIIGGQFYAPYQYRVAATWLAEAGGWLVEKTLGLAPGKPAYLAREAMYILQRLIATWLLLVAFHLYLETWFTPELAFSGTLILAGLHTYTYHSYFYQPDSVINLLHLTIGALWIVRGATTRLYPLMFIASFVRETSGLLIAIFLAHRWRTHKGFLHALGLFAVWLAVQLILRGMFGVRPFFPSRPFSIQIENLGWPLFLFAIFWIVPILRFKTLPPFLARLLVFMTPPLIVANFLFGKVEETRLFLDLAIVLIPATLIGMFGAQKSQ